MRRADKALAAAALALALAALLAGGASAASAQTCGFPWTVTATPAGGENVTITICGLYTGCHPHDPTVAVSGSEIRVTLTGAELPDCNCIAVEGTFQTSVTAHVAPGAYTIVAALLNCGQAVDSGTATVTVAQSAVIPALDARGAGVFILLIAIAAFWRLRP